MAILEAAFDAVAKDYDRHIFGNPINTWLRNVSVAVMSQLFKPGDTVLEVGCGTGTETLSLAKRGIRVVATDISSKMVNVLNAKAKESGVSDNVIGVHSRPVNLKEEYDKVRPVPTRRSVLDLRGNQYRTTIRSKQFGVSPRYSERRCLLFSAFGTSIAFTRCSGTPSN